MSEVTKFEKRGTAYVLTCLSNGDVIATLTLRHLKRHSGELHATIAIQCYLAGAKTYDGLLVDGVTLNVASWQAHGTMAKRLTERAATGSQIDWLAFLDELCIKTSAAEERGEADHEVGDDPPTSVHSRWAIEPLAIRQGVSVIYGAGGGGKSYLAYALALSVELGREIVPGCPPAMKGRAVYLDWETNRATANDRVRAIAAGAGVTGGTLNYRRMRRPLTDVADEVAEHVASKEATFVVIDSVERAMGAKSEYSDMTDAVMRLYEAIDLMGPVSVLLIDHIPKSEIGSKFANGPIGAVAKENAARLTHSLITRRVNDAMEMTLHYHKGNDVPWHQPIGLRLGIDDEGARFAPAEVRSKSDEQEETEGPPTTRSIAGQIRELLDDPGVGYTQEAIAEHLGLNPDSVRVTLYRNKAFARDDDGVWRMNRAVALRSVPGGREGTLD